MYLKRGRMADSAPPPSNPNATVETRLLYARLKSQFGSRAGAACPMFIGGNETGGTTPVFTATQERIQALTGKKPYFRPFFWVSPANGAYSAQLAMAKEHVRAGGITGTIWHPNNYLTGGNNYDRSRDDWDAVLACLSPGGSRLAQYRADLDIFANALNTDFRDDNGKKIPLIVRIGNEHNGWFDYPDMTVTSLTRSGTTATMTFTRGANPLAAQWAAANTQFKIRGASDSKWNKTHYVGSYVAAGDGSGGTVTFTVTDSPTSNPSGTILVYPLAGDWWAGADRAADALTLWRQTIDYLRDVRGCDQIIWCCNLFAYNRATFSTNPANFPYSTWLNGMENYWDCISFNFYQDLDPATWPFHDVGHPEVTGSIQSMIDWAGSRPVFVYEYGARVAGRLPGWWEDDCMGRMDTNPVWRRVAGVTTWTPDVFLPVPGTPAGNEFGVAFDKSRYRWLNP